MQNQAAPDPVDCAPALYERQLEGLSELAEMGLRLARRIEQADEVGPETAIAFGRVARAVRLTYLLQDQVIKTLAAHARHADYLATCRRIDRKQHVESIVERIASAEQADPDEVEHLVADASDRLDREDLMGDVLTKPLSELVARICEDLGLSPDWRDLAKEAWAGEEMASGVVGWPLASEPIPSPTGGGRTAQSDGREGTFAASPPCRASPDYPSP